jgi:O-6-methylguanine DNA methyltransferase
MHTVEISSPLGTLVITEDEGAIIELIFKDGSSKDFPLFEKSGAKTLTCATENETLRQCVRELDMYFKGELREFSVPFKASGTPFREKVWAALCTIPYGETISYKQLAERIGQPSAVRAVGGANHHNPISIIIPCHRVIGADGSLTGYGGGLPSKEFLLTLETARSAVSR